MLFLQVNSAGASLHSKPCAFSVSPHRLTGSSHTETHSAKQTLLTIPQEREWSRFTLHTPSTPLHSPPQTSPNFKFLFSVALRPPPHLLFRPRMQPRPKSYPQIVHQNDSRCSAKPCGVLTSKAPQWPM